MCRRGVCMRKLLINGLALMLMVLVVWVIQVPAYAAFEKFNDLPGIVICEVKSYGENTLKKEFLTTFAELLAEKLQESGKFRIEQRMNMTTVEKAMLSEMHMDAIVNSRNFVKAKSSMDLVRYSESVSKKGKAKGETHFASGYMKAKMREVAREHNAKYLAFCNVKMVDVVLKNPMTSSELDEQSLKGMKMRMAVDYYLVNADTGKVFAGTSFTDKTTQVVNLLFVKHGKTFTVQQLLHAILESQADRVADHISHEGLDKVCGDDVE